MAFSLVGLNTQFAGAVTCHAANSHGHSLSGETMALEVVSAASQGAEELDRHPFRPGKLNYHEC